MDPYDLERIVGTLVYLAVAGLAACVLSLIAGLAFVVVWVVS